MGLRCKGHCTQGHARCRNKVKCEMNKFDSVMESWWHIIRAVGSAWGSNKFKKSLGSPISNDICDLLTAGSWVVDVPQM